MAVAIHGPIADTGISKIFKSCFLLHYQKYNAFYTLLFFINFKNQDLWAKIFQTAAISIFFYGLINLINDDAFVLAATADACTILSACLWNPTC